MTELQTLEIESSELRDKLNTLSGVADPSEEQVGEIDTLSASLRKVEARRRAAIAASDPEPVEEPDSEARELADLRSRANLGAIWEAAVEHRQTDGAERELQAASGIPSNSIPLELLAAPVEKRAVTPAPTNTGASERPPLAPVFANGDAAFLGFDMPTVPAGDAVFPVVATRPTVHGPVTDATSQAETTGSFTAEKLVPNRLSAAFSWLRTDAARFASLAESLRAALVAALSEKVDAQAVAQVVTDTTRTAAGSSAWTWAKYRALVPAQVDGRFASMESEIRFLIGAGTLADADALFRGDDVGEESAVETMRRLSGGVRVSAHITAPASNLQDVLIRKGNAPGAVAPTWQGVSLIPDELTGAATGTVKVTAVLLAAFKVIRADVFGRQNVKHA